MANSLIPAECRRGRILDVGCGPHPYFLLNTEFQEKYGLDQAVDPLTLERKVIQSIDLQKYSIAETERLPFADNFFDVVTMLAVFEHITPPLLSHSVKEIRRVLKRGRPFIITTPAWWTDGLLRLLSRLGLVSRTEIEDHKDTYTPAKIVAILEHSGFPRKQIRSGHFELGMNIWVRAEK
jgi:ubiquinone/menaquinone biosynthesis C-methylase UbiE